MDGQRSGEHIAAGHGGGAADGGEGPAGGPSRRECGRAGVWGPAGGSEGCTGYLPAILGHCGWWGPPARRQDKGPWPKPRWMPRPGRLYAQVVKQSRRKRVVGGEHRVACGTREAIAQVLAAWGWQSKTAFVERRNLDLCQRGAAIGRRGNTRCQGEDSRRHQLAVCHVYDNFVLPQAS